MRQELKNWIQRSRAEHEECRNASKQQGMSLVGIILALSSVSSLMSDAQHMKAIEYLSVLLSIRDREEITKSLCQRNPDVLTAAVRDAFEAYTPMIRRIHEAVNLSDTAWDFERFVTDMLKIAKPDKSKTPPQSPSVEDFVDLLHRHQYSSHKFLHQVAKNGKEVTSWWQEYVHLIASHFRSNEPSPSSKSLIPPSMSAGVIQQALEKTFASLSESEQQTVKAELDTHKQTIDELHETSAARIRAVIHRWHSTPLGPGAYIARWQQLMQNTAITPRTYQGPVRYGTAKKAEELDLQGAIDEPESQPKVEAPRGDAGPAPQSVPGMAETTLRLLGPRFRELLTSHS